MRQLGPCDHDAADAYDCPRCQLHATLGGAIAAGIDVDALLVEEMQALGYTVTRRTDWPAPPTPEH